MIIFILFVFGAIVGSFLNVVALRFNTGLNLLGRSSCSSCGEKLLWWELVPILSFLFLRGRCRSCKVRIPVQYPLVELWTGLIFVTVPSFLIPAFCLYVVITIYDLRHKIVPDALVYTSIFLAFSLRLFYVSSILDWLAGPILFAVFGGLWLFSKGKAMGFGDAKLVLSVGLLLGAAASFSGIILAFWLGAIFGLSLISYSKFIPLLTGGKKITMKSEIPFAPFIILGAWLSIIFQLDLLHVSFF